MVAVGTMKLRRADTASGMPMECPPPQYQGGAGFADPGDQLGQGQAGFHIAAHRVQDHQQPFDGRVLLNVHQLRDHMFVLGGFLVFRRQRVALDGADHGQAVDGMAAWVASSIPASSMRSCFKRNCAVCSVPEGSGCLLCLDFTKTSPFTDDCLYEYCPPPGKIFGRHARSRHVKKMSGAPRPGLRPAPMRRFLFWHRAFCGFLFFFGVWAAA